MLGGPIGGTVLRHWSISANGAVVMAPGQILVVRRAAQVSVNGVDSEDGANSFGRCIWVGRAALVSRRKKTEKSIVLTLTSLLNSDIARDPGAASAGCSGSLVLQKVWGRSWRRALSCEKLQPSFRAQTKLFGGPSLLKKLS